jgi:hypothetical protein
MVLCKYLNWPIGPNDQHSRRLAPPRDRGNQLERREITPVQVFKHQHHTQARTKLPRESVSIALRNDGRMHVVVMSSAEDSMVSAGLDESLACTRYSRATTHAVVLRKIIRVAAKDTHCEGFCVR